MNHQLPIRGAGIGALVGGASTLVLGVAYLRSENLLPLSLDPWSLLLLWGLVVALMIGVPAGTLAGGACGLCAALLVGGRHELAAVRPRVALGSMLLPLLAAAGLGWWPLLLPAAVGTTLLLLCTPAELHAAPTGGTA